MARISIMDICDGITATFHGLMITLNAGSPAVALIAQSYDELTEGIQDAPVLQILPTNSEVDAQTDTDRTTFKGCVKDGKYSFDCIGYARQRSQLAEDFEASIRMWDALEAIMEEVGTDCDPATGTCAYFGVAGIKGITWTAIGRVAKSYGGVNFVGPDMNIIIEVF